MRHLKKYLLPLGLLLGFVFFSHSIEATTEKIYDQAGIFSSERIPSINEAIAEFEKSSGMEAIVVTNDEFTGKSAMEYADDFYVQHGFGTGTDKSGILFLIDLDTRVYWISTSGRGIKLFNDERIERLLDKGESAMVEGNYPKATLNVLKAATAHSDNYTFNEAKNTYQRVRRIRWYEALVGVVIALLASSGFFLTIQRKYNLKERPYTYPFREEGSLDLTSKEDSLINTATTSRYIPPASSNNSSGGGGSSTHTSSGGSSHGGGGRSF